MSGAADATREEAAVRDFFRRWSQSWDELCASFRDSMAADCVWWNAGFPSVTGIDGCIGFMAQFRQISDFATIDVDLRTVIGRPGLLVTERVDHLRRSDGSLIVSVPVTGVMEIVDGRIQDWREYADTAPLQALAAQTGRGADS